MRLRTLALVLVLWSLAGCDGKPELPATYDSLIPPEARVIPATPRSYKLVSTVIPEVGTLRGITMTADGRLLALGSKAVQVFDADLKKTVRWEVPEQSRAIAVTPTGIVLVALETTIIGFELNGKRRDDVKLEVSATAGPRNITSIAMTLRDLFVADSKAQVILRYDTNGVFRNYIARADRANKVLGLRVPSPLLDVTTDARGNVVVTNTGYRRVEVYSPDGKLLSYFGERGILPHQFPGCCNPVNVALLADGSFVTAEKGTVRVKVYAPDGSLLAYIPPSEFSQKAQGMDLAVDRAGRIYVAEPVSGAIMIYRENKPK